MNLVSRARNAFGLDKYVCPRTRAPLRVDGDTLRAATGDVVYPVRSGIPDFLRFGAAEDNQTRAQLERLNRLALDKGWRAALHSVYGENSPMVRYVTEAARASFMDLLPLTEQSEVLEIGPGLGQFTALLAHRARSVHALEVVAGQAEFAAERCKQSGVVNVRFAVGGDDCRLPYADGEFDVVVLNLVFEWCASRCLDEAEADVQNRLLAEMHRVLKRGGSVYLATKNRFALRHLIGKPDEHCHETRFGSALPRWIAQCLLRLKGHPRALGRLYSHNALKGMLRDVGFDKIDSFWAAPEMRVPTHYVPTDTASIRQARREDGFVQGELRSTRLLMPMVPAPLVKHFTPGLAFLATKHR